MKKFLALILSIMMLATFMPMMALAETTLAAPTKVELKDELLKWSTITVPSGATVTAYEITVYDSTGTSIKTATVPYYSGNPFYGAWVGDYINEAGTYGFTVKAVAEGYTGTESTMVQAEFDGSRSLTLDEGTTIKTYNTTKNTIEDATKSLKGPNFSGSGWIARGSLGYYVVELSEEAVIDTVVMITNTGNNSICNDGIIEYSSDGVEWSSVTGNVSSEKIHGSYNHRIISFETPITAKYIKSEKVVTTAAIGRIGVEGIYKSEEIEQPEVVIDVPTNVSLTDEILTWNPIEDTTATYLVNVYNDDGSLNQQIDTTPNSNNSWSCYIGDYINAAGTYKITVQAKVGKNVSAPTEEITVELDGNQNLSLTSTSQTLYNTTAGTSSTFKNNMGTHPLGENIYGYLQIDLAQASMIENFTLVVNAQSDAYVNDGKVKFSADGTTWFETKCSIAEKVRVGGYYNHILTPQAPIYAKYVRFEKTSAKLVRFYKAVIDGKAVEPSTAATALENFLKVAPVATDSTKNSYDAYNFAGSIASGNTAVIECVNTTAPIAIVSGLTAKVPTYVKTSAEDDTKASSQFKITVTNTDGSTATGMFSIERRVLETGYTFPSIAVNNIAVANAGDKVKATVTVTNDNIEEAGSAVVLVAIYKKNGELLTMQSVSPATTIRDFAPMEAVDAREVEIDAPTEAGTYVAKAFVLKNMNTIVPLAAAGVTEFTVQ